MDNNQNEQGTSLKIHNEKNNLLALIDDYSNKTTHNDKILVLTKYVEVSVRFLSVGEIDTMNEKYQAEIYVESKWPADDPKLTTYDPKVNWNPQLYVENALQDVKEQITYQITESSGSLIVTETRYLKGLLGLSHIKVYFWYLFIFLKGNFWERLELENFPLDIQGYKFDFHSAKFNSF